jgi:hypothetical protein
MITVIFSESLAQQPNKVVVKHSGWKRRAAASAMPRQQAHRRGSPGHTTRNKRGASGDDEGGERENLLQVIGS